MANAHPEPLGSGYQKCDVRSIPVTKSYHFYMAFYDWLATSFQSIVHSWVHTKSSMRSRMPMEISLKDLPRTFRVCVMTLSSLTRCKADSHFPKIYSEIKSQTEDTGPSVQMGHVSRQQRIWIRLCGEIIYSYSVMNSPGNPVSRVAHGYLRVSVGPNVWLVSKTTGTDNVFVSACYFPFLCLIWIFLRITSGLLTIFFRIGGKLHV